LLTDGMALRKSQAEGSETAIGAAHTVEAHAAPPSLARPRPWPWLLAGMQKDSEKNASYCLRYNRQNRPIPAPAPRQTARDASKATPPPQTWLLTRTQQNTVLSKQVASKQPLKEEVRGWRESRSSPYSSRAMPGSAGTNLTSTSSLRSKPLLLLVRRTRV